MSGGRSCEVHVTDLTIQPGEAQSLQYELRVALRSSAPRLLEYTIVSNPSLEEEFDKKSKDSLIVDSWVNVRDLKPGTPSSIASEGVEIGEFGTDYPVGTILLTDLEEGKTEHEFCLCSVNIGRSFCVPEEVRMDEDCEEISSKESPSDKSRPRKSVLPDGFDSILIESASDDTSRSMVTGIPNCHYEYTIFDSTQVLPRFFVRFRYDPTDDIQKSTPICELCGKKEAVVFCEQCVARFCIECDMETHPSSHRILAAHSRGSLREKDVGTCPYHSHLQVEFYCPQCQQPVCVACKMTGNHSTGETGNHKLIGMNAAYWKAIKASNRHDPSLERKGELIADEEKKLEERLTEVERNATKVEEALYSRLFSALLQLRMEVGVKQGILRADLAELRRQRAELKLHEEFLEYERRELPFAPFISAWASHKRRVQYLRETAFIERKDDILPDLKAVGKLAVERFGEGEDEEYHDIRISRAPSTPQPRGGGLAHQQPSTPFRKLLFEYEPPSPRALNVVAHEELVRQTLQQIEERIPPRLSVLHQDDPIPFSYSAKDNGLFIEAH